MKGQSEFLRYISKFSGEFTIGAVERPLSDICEILSADNPPLELRGPIADEGSYEVHPCIVLTQAKDSDWTLIQYCLEYYLPKAEDHLERLSKDVSARAVLHAYEDTSAVEEMILYSDGRAVTTYRDSGTQELVTDYLESTAEYMETVQDDSLSDADMTRTTREASKLTIVKDYGVVYDQLRIHPIAATVDTSRTLRVESSELAQIEAAVAYELASFRWRGLVDVEGSWTERIDLVTFRLSSIHLGFTTADSLVLVKSKEDIQDREVVQTAYYLATDDGLESMDKRAASDLLAQRAIAQMKHTKRLPIKMEIKRSYKNGNVDLLYKPSKYDQFILKLNQTNVGQNVQEFLNTLAAARRNIRYGSVEKAKSGRSTCRTCDKKIEKGQLRIGEYYEDSYEYPPSQWHHAGCVAFSDIKRLYKFDELSSEDQSALAQLVDS